MAPEGHADEVARQALEPIRVYTAEMVIDGWVTTHGERMTDILQRVTDFPLLPQGANPDDPEAWVRMPTTQCLLLVPPPHVSPPELRQARDKREVRVRAGDYGIIGTAHLRPGLEHDAYTRATQPFLPLTGATVMRFDGMQPEAFEVVIVNLHWAEFVS
jgi:hypothetical protein